MIFFMLCHCVFEVIGLNIDNNEVNDDDRRWAGKFWNKESMLDSDTEVRCLRFSSGVGLICAKSHQLDQKPVSSILSNLK